MPSDRRRPLLGPLSQPTASRWSTAIAFARDRAAAALWPPSAAHPAGGIAVNRKKLRRLFGHCVQSEARRTAPLQHRTGQPQTVTRPSHHRMSSSPRSTHSLCPKPLKQRNPNSHHSALDNSSASSSHRGSTQACFYTIRHSSAIASKSNKIISRDAILTRYWTTH